METSGLAYKRSQLAKEDGKLMLTWALSKQQIMHTHVCAGSGVGVWRGPSGTSRSTAGATFAPATNSL